MVGVIGLLVTAVLVEEEVVKIMGTLVAMELEVEVRRKRGRKSGRGGLIPHSRSCVCRLRRLL